MAEAESVSARNGDALNPTEEDETVQVLRRRLFESIDEASIPSVTDAYRGALGSQPGVLGRRCRPLRKPSRPSGRVTRCIRKCWKL